LCILAIAAAARTANVASATIASAIISSATVATTPAPVARSTFVPSLSCKRKEYY